MVFDFDDKDDSLDDKDEDEDEDEDSSPGGERDTPDDRWLDGAVDVDPRKRDKGIVRFSGEEDADESFPHENSEVLSHDDEPPSNEETSPAFSQIQGEMRMRRNKRGYLSTAAWSNVEYNDSEEFASYLGHIRHKDLPKGCSGVWPWLYWLRDHGHADLYEIVHRTVVLSDTVETVACDYNVSASTISRWRKKANDVYEQGLSGTGRTVKQGKDRKTDAPNIAATCDENEDPGSSSVALTQARAQVIALLKQGWSLDLAASEVGVDANALAAYLAADADSVFAEVGRENVPRDTPRSRGQRRPATKRSRQMEQARYSIVEAIDDYWQTQGKAPSVRVIRDAIGGKSMSSLLRHIDALITEGRLTRDAQGGLCLPGQQH